jgi:hypothetical protein
MLGYICLYVPVRFGVAEVAVLIQDATGTNFQRLVDLPVTCAALFQIRAVDQFVTFPAPGKNFFVCRPAWAVDMELLMALPAVKPMFAASVLEEVINKGMALPALFRFQGFNFHGRVRGNIIFRVKLVRNRRSTPDMTQAEHNEGRYYVVFESHCFFGPRQMYISISLPNIRA